MAAALHLLLLAAFAALASAGLSVPGHELQHPKQLPQPAAAVAAAPKVAPAHQPAAVAAPADQTFFERCNQGQGWVKFRDSCYYFYEQPEYWYVAEQICRNHSGHLVSVLDQTENSFVGKLTYCKAAWLGRFAVNADAIVDATNYRWTDGSNKQFHAHNFVNSPGLHHPLVSTSNLQWSNNVYHARHNFVCKVQAPTKNYTCDCPTGWKQLGQFCYHSPMFEATYIESDFYCRGRNAYVTSIHTEAELRAISLVDLDTHGCPAETWIGLLKLNPCRNDFSSGNSSSTICYRWSDRSGEYDHRTSIPKWEAGSPNPDRVTNCVLLKDRNIRTVPCHTRARFVCKKPVLSLTRTP